MKDIFLLIRPQQYIKNMFIFMPLFFMGEIADGGLLLRALLAFIAFSASASAIYILNDYQDIEEDRLHPKKKIPPPGIRCNNKKISSFYHGDFICYWHITDGKYFNAGNVNLMHLYCLKHCV